MLCRLLVGCPCIKTSAADPVLPSVLKATSSQVSPFFVKLINCWFKTGHLLRKFKYTLIMHNLKKIDCMSQLSIDIGQLPAGLDTETSFGLKYNWIHKNTFAHHLHYTSASHVVTRKNRPNCLYNWPFWQLSTVDSLLHLHFATLICMCYRPPRRSFATLAAIVWHRGLALLASDFNGCNLTV